MNESDERKPNLSRRSFLTKAGGWWSPRRRLQCARRDRRNRRNEADDQSAPQKLKTRPNRSGASIRRAS